MIHNENIFHSKISKLFPFINEEDFPEFDVFKNNVINSKIPHAKIISIEGDSCGYLSFVISGVVRVYKIGETGREITLYRLYEGDSCILTASCIVSNSTFPAFSVAETDVEVFSVPSILFSE